MDIFSPLFVAVVSAAYLIGAIPSALLLSRIAGLPDPRTYGSGNVGATNVARSGNKSIAILTLFADGGKGALAVFTANALLADSAAIAGAVAVLGHITSPFLKFRGGRGVATALAVYLCWQPAIGAAVLAVWGLVFALCRYSSLASLAASFAASGLCWWLMPPAFFVAALCINLLIVVRHIDNLRRLVSGTEQGFRK